ncbi:hypothetical protein C2G38_2200167 [Gigaspora rosea]|uniref:Uncharacterized protein n=1 Tax=Gigaspora rosea TaxID=44941 RepID=A0A397UTC3_9GLOM|nr:hypothetical protein C2G38_2200167 [Gigaspora rosea]
MNPEIPEERKYIEELTQEYIYLCEELSSKERYKVEGKDIYNRGETSEIKIVSKNLYIAKRLLKRIKVLYEAIQEEITRIESEQLSRFINILHEEEPRFLRSIIKDYIDLQDSNQENNIVEQILSKEELNIKLQGLLDQIKIQIQTLQGQLTLEEAYKNHEYTFLFKRAIAIYKTINGSKPEIIVQRKYLSQIRKLVEFYIKVSNLTEYCNLKLEELIALEQGETQNNKELNLAVKLATLLALFKLLTSTYDEDYISSSLIKESIFRYLNTLQPTDPLRKESEDLINNLSGNTKNRYNQELSKLILLNWQHNLMNEEQNRTLEELRRFRFNWQPISTPTRRKKTKRYPRDKDILESRELIQITNDIWETINNLINRINPTNNPRLGAILLTLEGAKNTEGARNKIYFEEEESYESAYSEINKLSQEIIDKTKQVKELRKEKERLEQVTNKIINRILLKNEPVEKPKRTRSNSL